MILGMSIFLFIHVVLSLAAIVAGFVVLNGLLGAQRLPGWTALFLATTALTSATGFFLPADRFLPSHGVGILSLVVLLVAILALYVFHLSMRWRAAYVVTALAALWFNVFVLVAQAFNKVPALIALAPTQSEPPFLIAQTIVMVIFIFVGIAALRKFHPAA